MLNGRVTLVHNPVRSLTGCRSGGTQAINAGADMRGGALFGGGGAIITMLQCGHTQMGVEIWYPV